MTSNPELEQADPTDDEEEATPESVTEEAEDDPAAHLKDLEDGAGCAEIWSHLSESRDDE